jgi:hypothetical protein
MSAELFGRQLISSIELEQAARLRRRGQLPTVAVGGSLEEQYTSAGSGYLSDVAAHVV